MTKTLKELCDSISRELVVAKDWSGDPQKDAVRIANHLFYEVNEFLRQYDVNKLYTNVADTAIAEPVHFPVAPTEGGHYVVPKIDQREVTSMKDIVSQTSEAAQERFREGKRRALREMKNGQPDIADKLFRELPAEDLVTAAPEPPPGYQPIVLPQ